MRSRNIELMLSFTKIGAFTFGGGYAMIPVIEKEVVEEKKWIDDGEMLDMIAVSQSTPGPLAINCATFVGYRVNGFSGAFFATLGVVLPSFLIILLIGRILAVYRDNRYVDLAFSGIKAGVIVLIFDASLRLSKNLDRNLFTAAVGLSSFILCAFTGINVIWVLVAAGTAGLLYSFMDKREGEE